MGVYEIGGPALGSVYEESCYCIFLFGSPDFESSQMPDLGGSQASEMAPRLATELNRGCHFAAWLGGSSLFGVAWG